MTHAVFINGQADTTGLQPAQRLASHGQVRLLNINPRFRKDAGCGRLGGRGLGAVPPGGANPKGH